MKEKDLDFFIIVPLNDVKKNLVNKHQSQVKQVVDEVIQQQ